MQQEKKLETIEIKEPPYSIDVEQEILGNILLNDKLMEEVKDTIKSDMFYNLQHKDIYTAMLYLSHTNTAISYNTLLDRLVYKGYDEEIIDYLIKLGGSVASTSIFSKRCEYLIDIYRKRVLYDLYKKRLQEDLSGIASSNLVKEIEDKIDNMGITNNLETDDFSSYIDDWVIELEKPKQEPKYRTGFTILDDTILIEDSNLILIGARPSVGKSALALDLTKRFCMQGNKALFVSLEMSKKEIMNRLVANEAHVQAKKLKRKENITSSDWINIMSANKKIKEYNLNIYAKGNMYIEQLVGLCKYQKKNNNLDILIVDYLQLLDSHSHSKNRVQQIGYISRKLKQLAMELNIPVIALSQLSRASIESNGKPREPQLSDLRDSGSLEQDANIILMLHTDDIEQKFQDRRFLKLFVRKNRDGRLDTITMNYYGDYVEFKETQWNNGTNRYEEVYQAPLSKQSDTLEDLPF